MRCATCKHWEYAELYESSWGTEPDDHLFAWGACALLNDEERDVREVSCTHCDVHRRGRDVRAGLEARGEHTYPTIDTHWTFGCILYEPGEHS